ncbi:S26 family signal peptidase [Halobaculum magnesiiphilum]|uniref:S26 family signal peptidase n=1 Tax=Halobaculum magnesiiphilum TaxID=1017351 RepID=A0A8T8W9D1_9EURY|nr:S26 family signal peptidase [Halobaculum magnesiiphilum]QZP36426.1 S26 family signal peptidase [Halobaculum magnesiiphilum]
MSDEGRSPDDPLSRFLHAETGAAVFVREVLTSVLAVALIGLLLFAVSGVWPPMVAVESGSMEPHMERGDLVFITEPDRFSPEFAHGDTGIVTYETGASEGYGTFGEPGSVIVYHPPGSGGSPIIHRARLHVEEGENWVDRANPDYLPATSCEGISACPAPYDGFITKGDANAEYDQVSGIAPVVKSEWIHGVARVRVPYLGYVRLVFSEAILVQSNGAGDGLVSASDSGGDASEPSGEGAGAVEPPTAESNTTPTAEPTMTVQATPVTGSTGGTPTAMPA